MNRTRLLLACFRSGEADDPETYVAAISATLMRYPQDVIKDVTTPGMGLTVKTDWRPTVREVYLACEEIMRPRREHAARQERVRKQLADRLPLPGDKPKPNTGSAT